MPPVLVCFGEFVYFVYMFGMPVTIPDPVSNFEYPADTLVAVIPDQRDAELAKVSYDALGPILEASGDIRLTVVESNGAERAARIPASALRLLLSVLSEMARGNAVSLIPLHAEVSTQEAADFLNVSRPYFVGLLDEGAIPYRKVGVRRGVLFSDLVAYRARSDAERRMALDALASQAQDLGLGYDG